jgi:hypothetical protein
MRQPRALGNPRNGDSRIRRVPCNLRRRRPPHHRHRSPVEAHLPRHMPKRRKLP